MRVDESECTVSGVGADNDGLLCDIAGSVNRSQKQHQHLSNSLA